MSEASASISRIPGEIRMAWELLSPLRARVAAAFALPLLAVLAACGTAHSRAGRAQTPENGYSFGTPLYAAVAHDGVLFWEGNQSGACVDSFGIERVGALLCLPVDLVLDTVFLPLDLLSAAFGHSKLSKQPAAVDASEPRPKT